MATHTGPVIGHIERGTAAIGDHRRSAAPFQQTRPAAEGIILDAGAETGRRAGGKTADRRRHFDEADTIAGIRGIDFRGAVNPIGQLQLGAKTAAIGRQRNQPASGGRAQRAETDYAGQARGGDDGVGGKAGSGRLNHGHDARRRAIGLRPVAETDEAIRAATGQHGDIGQIGQRGGGRAHRSGRIIRKIPVQPANRHAAGLNSLTIKSATARADEGAVIGGAGGVVVVHELAIAGELGKPEIVPAGDRIVVVRGQPGDEAVLFVIVQFPINAIGIGEIAGVHHHAAHVIGPDAQDIVLGKNLKLRGDIRVGHFGHEPGIAGRHAGHHLVSRMIKTVVFQRPIIVEIIRGDPAGERIAGGAADRVGIDEVVDCRIRPGGGAIGGAHPGCGQGQDISLPRIFLSLGIRDMAGRRRDAGAVIGLAEDDRSHAGDSGRRQIALQENAGQPQGTAPFRRLPIGADAAPAPFIAAGSVIAAGHVGVKIIIQRLANPREAIGKAQVIGQSEAQNRISEGDAAIATDTAIARATAVAPVAGIRHGSAGVPDGFGVSLKIGQALQIDLLRIGLGLNLGTASQQPPREEETCPTIFQPDRHGFKFTKNSPVDRFYLAMLSSARFRVTQSSGQK